MHEGEARGNGRPTQILPGVPVALAADAAAARRLAAWWLAPYTTRDQPEEELAAVVDVAGRLAAATASGGP